MASFRGSFNKRGRFSPTGGNIYRRVQNKFATCCSRCAASMQPGEGVAILLRGVWRPFCEAHDPGDAPSAEQAVAAGTAGTLTIHVPAAAAAVLGESTPGWRRERERRAEHRTEKMNADGRHHSYKVTLHADLARRLLPGK